MKQRKIFMVIFVIAALFILGSILIYPSFNRDIHEAYKKINAIPHQIIQTECGQIDTALRGEGIPVLISHGIAGGYDQGLGLADAHLSKDMMAIAPSRFGYQGTYLPDDATPAMQADAFACLLDALGIPKAVVMANSAGGTAAIRYALRHPDRMTAFVLVSSAAPSVIETAPLPPKPVIETIFKSDLMMWLITSKFQKIMMPIVGVPKGYALNADEETLVNGLISSILPIRPRQAGFVFDMFTSNKDMDLHPNLTLPEAIPSSLEIR